MSLWASISLSTPPPAESARPGSLNVVSWRGCYLCWGCPVVDAFDVYVMEQRFGTMEDYTKAWQEMSPLDQAPYMARAAKTDAVLKAVSSPLPPSPCIVVYFHFSLRSSLLSPPPPASHQRVFSCFRGSL